MSEDRFNFSSWCRKHWEWSQKTFGPAEDRGPEGPVDHLKKEIQELEEAIENPKDGWGDGDLEEVVDIIHLAVDCALRAGHSVSDLTKMLDSKQKKNHARIWPDWRNAPKGKAIEHVKQGDSGASPHPPKGCEHCDNPDYDGGQPCPHCQPLIGKYDDRDE